MTALVFLFATLVKEDIFKGSKYVWHEVSGKGTRKEGFIVQLEPAPGQSSRQKLSVVRQFIHWY